TYTLPEVASPISKNELQPGDVLNNRYGGGNSDFAHVAIFAGCSDAAGEPVNHVSDHYDAYEEAGYSGAHEITNMPYPYYSSYFNNQLDYVPMRLTSLISQPSTSLPSPSPVS